MKTCNRRIQQEINSVDLLGTVKGEELKSTFGIKISIWGLVSELLVAFLICFLDLGL